MYIDVQLSILIRNIFLGDEGISHVTPTDDWKQIAIVGKQDNHKY